MTVVSDNQEVKFSKKEFRQEVMRDIRYLSLLARDFPNISQVTTEIINLEAILHLPKPTEHFLADLHGENEAFQHVLRNASGNIKRKVEELFGGTMREQDKRDLCTLIYYPEQKLELVKQHDTQLEDYYQATLHRLITICRNVSSKYTRSKVRKSLPKEFAYIIEELLHESHDARNKQAYYQVIVQTIIDTKRADHFIIAICNLIQRLAIDQLHILGDIYDRGPGAHLIMDTLSAYHNLDIQWGNHDIIWMGAAGGNQVCMAAVLRMALRYGNMQTLEEGYAINLVPLATFALEAYADDDCELFAPKCLGKKQPTLKQRRLMAKMHKAMAVLQFKLECQMYLRHPEWRMEDRALLLNCDFEKGSIVIDGVEHLLKDNNFLTIDPKHPERLTDEERELTERLRRSFRISERLQRHVACLLSRGSMYNVVNSNLLFHAAIPMDEEGRLKSVDVLGGVPLSGRDLMERIDQTVRAAFDEAAEEEEKSTARDFFWYLWCGPDSPLFHKSKMATFERYFIEDKSTWKEVKGAYYQLRDSAAVCDYIMDCFDVVGEHRHIINGHVPVHVSNGESPIKADGKLMVIDGGFAEAYHNTTGIAGYTLVYHSRGFQLVQHEPFTSTSDAISKGTDIVSSIQVVELTGHREMVAETDKGREIRAQIAELKKLLFAYRKGIIKERS